MKTSSPQRIAALTDSGAWGNQTLHGMLAKHAAEIPERLAVKDQPNRVSLIGDAPLALGWAQLHAAASSLATQLQTIGVGADSRLLVQLPNVVELLVLYYACSRLGAIISPVPVQYGAHELGVIAAALKPDLAVSIPGFRGDALGEKMRDALPELSVLEFGRDLKIDPEAPGQGEVTGVDANDILSICWTSGTTGTPKGVPRSHNMWFATARCTMLAGDYRHDDVLLNPFPLVNMAALGGFLFPAALLGCGIVLHHPLDPTLYLQQLQDEAVSFTIAPPALLNQLAKTPDMWRQWDFGALRSVGSGSAPLAPWMIDTFGREYGVEVVNFYGSNEGIALFATPDSAPDPETRASRFCQPGANTGVYTRVVDPDTGQSAEAGGERGELLIAGATVFDGYFEHDNADVFTDDGYFRTGDLVEVSGGSPQSYQIVGRCKDIINRGGMKISPTELDVALEEHPALAEAAVCAYPDERLGEKICACLVCAEGVDCPSIDDLQSYLLDRGFARFKLPERIEVVGALPRNPLGKVQRFVLQEQVARLIEESPT